MCLIVLFSEFPYNIFALHDTALAYKISHCHSANHNPGLRCLICTGVTLFTSVLHFLHWFHLNYTALSQSESSNFFMCIILII